MAKLNIVPVRCGYWGNAIGNPHTIPTKIHGKCGSVRCRLIPAPRGTGLVASPTAKKVL
jgi:small subunit ribosomal protein S2e